MPKIHYAQSDKERMAEISKKIKASKEKAEQADIEAHEKLLKSKSWKIFKWIAYACALLSLLITIDILLPGKKEKLERYDLHITDGFIVINDVWYTLYITEDGGGLQRFQPNSFECERSLIFNEITQVCWDSEKWQYDRDAPKIYEKRCAPSWNTIYYYSPGPSIAFIIPLLVVLFKRRSPWFKFFRFACWIVIYPGALILLSILLL